MGGTHIKREKPIYHIAGEHFDYRWSKEQVDTVKDMYKEGYDIRDIADKVRKTKYKDVEVFILLCDLICRGYMEEREGKIFGRRGMDGEE